VFFDINLFLLSIKKSIVPFFHQEALSFGGKKWFMQKPEERTLLWVQETYGISEYLAEFLLNRLSCVEDIEHFINPRIKDFLPDPSLLPDLDRCIDLVNECLTKGYPIGIWGDYDVDGATSAALMLRYFRCIKHPCKAHIPNRFEEGYGPNIPILKKFLDGGIKHLITVDCGSTSYEPLEWAKDQGMKVIIIDHHRVDTVFPANYGFINPKRPDFTGPLDLQKLCAAGLAFVFLVGLNRCLRTAGFFETMEEPNLMDMLDLVALGTVCDVMPLTHFNRALVSQGIKVLSKKPTLGLKVLCDVARIREKPRAYHLGYLLGPRINAGGRIGKSSLGVELLTTNKPCNTVQ
jgi:single-stranded-DNA-specific exonuclease